MQHSQNGFGPVDRRPAHTRQARLRFRRQRRSLGGGLASRLIGVLAALPLLFAVTLTATAVAASQAMPAVAAAFGELPSTDKLGDRTPPRASRIFDRNGELLYEFIDQDQGRRTNVQLKDVPQNLINATISTEDNFFYENPGFDVRGMARAVYQNLSGTGSAGGSTITQQLTRAVLIEPDERDNRGYNQQTFIRKSKEIVLSYQITQKYSKSEILEMYLNEIYYGNHSYGVQSAAENYFGKSVRDLNIAEAALLAGLVQAPSAYDPTSNPRAAKERQEYVLDLMVKQGYLSAFDAEIAKETALEYRRARFDIKAPHFVFFVRDQLLEKYGDDLLYHGGLSIYTTLDYKLQQHAQETVQRQISEVSKFQAHNAALVSIDPNTGEILAMVGSADYFDSSIDGEVNVATSLRQPGSSIKPITYVTAFRRGYTPATMVIDEPLTLSGGDGKAYAPKNNDGKFRGPVKLREALGNSLNIPAIKVLQFAGIQNMIDQAKSMGINSFKDSSRYGYSITLGGGEVKLVELTSAYSVFAAQGVRHDPKAILKIVDQKGRTLEELKVENNGNPLTPELAYLITDVLSDNSARAAEFGVQNPLRMTRPAAAKTGTTDESRDAWTVGYTPDLVTGVWVGNTDNKPMVGILGSRAAGPIWNDVMEYYHQGKPVKGFPRPDGIESGVTVCIERDSTGACSNKSSDIYIRGMKPVDSIDSYVKKALVCKLDNKLADSQCNPDDVEERSFLPYNGPDIPAELTKLGLPPLPTEKCACAKQDPTPVGGVITGTITGTVTPKPSTSPVAGTPSPASGSPVATSTPAPNRTPSPAANPLVAISSPASGGTVKGTVAIVGTANIQDFAGYKLEIGMGESSLPRKTIAESTNVVVGGTLGSFVSAGTPNGVHTIVLTVYDRAGRSQETRILIKVAN